jgi:isopentenyldiphosphate isomerase
MEYWDLYNKDREKLNKIHLRGNKISKGEYHIVVNAWIINDQNKIIVTQRHPEKTYPLKWECTGGSVITGEDSFTGALREVEEEIGIKLSKNKGQLIDTIIREDDIKDIYLFKENIKIEETKLQKEEVINIKWVTKEELEEMIKEGEIAEPIIYDIKIIENLIKEWKTK